MGGEAESVVSGSPGQEVQLQPSRGASLAWSAAVWKGTRDYRVTVGATCSFVGALCTLSPKLDPSQTHVVVCPYFIYS